MGITDSKQILIFAVIASLLSTPSPMLKYQTLNSSIHISFWQELSKRKLDTLGLSTDAVQITGRVQIANDPRLSSTVEISSDSFAPVTDSATTTTTIRPPTTTTKSHEYTIPGKLHIVNTLEDFKTRDKRKMLDEAANDLNTKASLSCPSELCEFFILVHADLKTHKFLYWFCFPAMQHTAGQFSPALLPALLPAAPTAPAASVDQSPSAAPVNNVVNVVINRALEGYQGDASLLRPMCALLDNEIVPLEEYVQRLQATDQAAAAVSSSSSSSSLVFFDPCPLADYPGWTARNLLTKLTLIQCIPRTINLHCLRLDPTRRRPPYAVRTFPLQLAPCSVVGEDNDAEEAKAGEEEKEGEKKKKKKKVTGIGWELDQKGRPRPRLANLSSSMDPRNLARVSVDLNVKLMRWRMLPELNVKLLQTTKCLLLGAGTLGCNVARCLMGWGVRNITFVDNGKVSYSNPVRQSLFRFDDCANGGLPKAQAAADELKRIFPDVNSVGVCMNIHMPGHTVELKRAKEVEKEVQELETLIENHDVIFLLTDTRESRWLPTMLAAKYDRMVINCALGFDSFLVMRHGANKNVDVVATETTGTKDEEKEKEEKEKEENKQEEKEVKTLRGDGGRLGCYFCQDIVAPGDSTRDRTLDQQCTVTRPGLALVAGALSVELMVGLLHHPLRHRAPADDSLPVFEQCERRLGLLPHQIRGYLTHYSNIVTHGLAFEQCTACSPKIRDEYEKNKFSFLHHVFNDSGKYLEELSGITELNKGAENFDLDDFAMSSDEEGSEF